VNIDSEVERIIEKNRLMLDENRKTIFIPVQFMVPALRLCKNKKTSVQLKLEFK